MKNTQPLFITVLLLTIQTIEISCKSNKSPERQQGNSSTFAGNESAPNTSTVNPSSGTLNFVDASKAVIPAVVHIKIQINTGGVYGSSFGEQYDSPGGGNAMASGSGVIISSDGYIATNNHVVENASQINVTLPDKRSFSAKLVGRDPNTDLALIKVDAQKLPLVKFGNSDNVQIGEWVLAVGFPLSLNSTVTAGIVSAKARSIGIISRQGRNNIDPNMQPTGNTAVESFIQTDAAINPGNSGGALVNTNGELIGINSAIASQTGSYAGYAFAVPVNLAKKILDDLRNYGAVKRGLLGVSFPSPSVEDQYMAQKGFDPAAVRGVYIIGVQPGSAAATAGLQEGDIIQSIDSIQLNSSTEFSERIARHKPGDVIKLTYLRNGKSATTSATLKSEETSSAANRSGALEEIYNKLGATFAPLTPDVKQHFNLNAGVLVTAVRRGGFFDQVGIPSGTIIAFINGRPVNSPKDIDSALLAAQSGTIQILAIAPDGSKVAFNFSLGT